MHDCKSKLSAILVIWNNTPADALFMFWKTLDITELLLSAKYCEAVNVWLVNVVESYITGPNEELKCDFSILKCRV